MADGKQFRMSEGASEMAQQLKALVQLSSILGIHCGRRDPAPTTSIGT